MQNTIDILTCFFLQAWKQIFENGNNQAVLPSSQSKRRTQGAEKRPATQSQSSNPGVCSWFLWSHWSHANVVTDLIWRGCWNVTTTRSAGEEMQLVPHPVQLLWDPEEAIETHPQLQKVERSMSRWGNCLFMFYWFSWQSGTLLFLGGESPAQNEEAHLTRSLWIVLVLWFSSICVAHEGKARIS